MENREIIDIDDIEITPMNKLRAPFPYFGGKRKVAHVVWQALGDVEGYFEPFGGSLAVYLARPKEHKKKFENVNDINGFVINFWRAVMHSPEKVAFYSSSVVSELDLAARHLWLVNQYDTLIERLISDPEYYDARVAGYWLFGINAWFGSHWCGLSEKSWLRVHNNKLAKQFTFWNPVVRQHLDYLEEVSMFKESLRYRRAKINRKRYRKSKTIRLKPISVENSKYGIHRKVPYSLHHGINGLKYRDRRLYFYKNHYAFISDQLLSLLFNLAERFQNTTIFCGDWKRTVPHAAILAHKTCGIFLDPPYDSKLRCGQIYSNEHSEGINEEIFDFCMKYGDDPRVRIALAGYEGEYEFPPSWRVIKWKASVVFQPSKNTNTKNRTENRFKERLWLSPHCLPLKLKVNNKEI